MATHATSSLECAIVGYDFYFTKYWCTTWGIYVLGNADGLRIFGSAQNNNPLKDPMFLLFGMGFHSIYKKKIIHVNCVHDVMFCIAPFN
jgi:hypothetical protein